MSGHTEAVSSIQWMNSTEIISGGWDHCIRLWDVPTGMNKDTLVSIDSSGLRTVNLFISSHVLLPFHLKYRKS